MHLSPILNQFLPFILYLLPFVVLAAILRSPWFKGVTGEFLVNVSAKIMLDKNAYHLIRNVTLPTEDGTTQIDHVIVSRYGVFVVETKNMQGWIYGNQNERRWTQKIYRQSRQFQNPLDQNYKHVKTLQSLLRLSDRQIFSVIAFVGGSTFKTKMPDNVTSGVGYVRYIKSKKESVLSRIDVMEIAGKIQQGRLTPSFKTHREHVKHVRGIVEKKGHLKSDSSPVQR